MVARRALVSSSDSAEITLIASGGGLGRGVVLAGRYEVERVLGDGGMGVVVSAVDRTTSRRCALKFLKPEAARHRDAVGRFLLEARCATQLSGEHVARVFDVGKLASGAPFFAMELLEGEDLARRLAREGPLPIDDVVAIGIQAATGLSEAHALGIVHRDVKPANLFLSEAASGAIHVKLLDFGLSKVVLGRDARKAKTITKGMMGTPLYMSPEVIRSARRASFASDVWGLGVVLYEALTDATPFDGESVEGVIASICTDAPIPLTSRRADVPTALAETVMRCFEKDPALRPTLEVLVAELRRHGRRTLLAEDQKPTKVIRLPGAFDAPQEPTRRMAPRHVAPAFRVPALVRSARHWAVVRPLPAFAIAALVALVVGIAAGRALAPEPEPAPGAQESGAIP